MSLSKLFQPIQVGRLTLQHRIVLAPLTRNKSGRMDHVPTVPLMKEYYAQRASAPGSLLITEGVFIAAEAGGCPNVPGIWSQPQIDAWKQITDAVHAKGSFIFLQLWAPGRGADPAALAAEDASFPFISASPLKLSDRPASEAAPRALSIDEIDEYVELHTQAARNAIQAGFDGVEVHAANGYLIDQFLQDVANVRDDEYGGSIENRSRFALRVVDAVTHAVGEDRTGIRLSPWSSFQDMGMRDPIPQFTHLITNLARAHPNLAYIHFIEPRVSGGINRAHVPHETNAPLRAAWAPRPVISAGGFDRATAIAGGFDRATAIAVAEEEGVLVAFGRDYISNPDLPKRLQEDIPLTPYDRETFYTPVDRPDAAHGYVDYPFAEETGRL